MARSVPPQAVPPVRFSRTHFKRYGYLRAYGYQYSVSRPRRHNYAASISLCSHMLRSALSARSIVSSIDGEAMHHRAVMATT
jgi:hypothetical protein